MPAPVRDDRVPAAFQRWAEHFSNMLTPIPQASPPGLLRGIADHATNNAAIFGTSVFTTGLISRNLNIYPFGEGRCTNLYDVELAYVFSSAVLSTHNKLTEGDRIARTIGEVSAVGLPAEMFADSATAQAKFVRAVKVVMRTPRLFQKYYRPTAEMYATAIQVPATPQEAAAAPPSEKYRAALHGLGLPAEFPWDDWTGAPGSDPLALTPETAMRCLMWFTRAAPTRDAANLGVTVQVNYYIAYSKMGNGTEAWLARTYGGLEREGLAFERLLPADLSNVYNYYGRSMVGQAVHALFEYWQQDLPEHLVRMKLVLTQSARSGLTPYLMVVKAMKTFPDFPWLRIRRLFLSEFVIFEQALENIGNMYYAFENNMTPFAGTKYKNVTWVARHVLMEFGGESTLRNLRGFSTTCKSIDVVRALCEEYRARLLPTDAEAPATAAETTWMDNTTRALAAITLTQEALAQCPRSPLRERVFYFGHCLYVFLSVHSKVLLSCVLYFPLYHSHREVFFQPCFSYAVVICPYSVLMLLPTLGVPGEDTHRDIVCQRVDIYILKYTPASAKEFYLVLL